MTTPEKQERRRAAGHAAMLMCASVVLLTLSAAPFGQWYLAWFALVPWLLAVGRAPSIRIAMFRGWLSGVLYFAANIWWLWTASIPGTILLIFYFALYWSIAAGLVRRLALLPPSDEEPSGMRTIYRVFALPTVWVAAEWLRCYVVSGFPWMPLGTTQSPILLMCQIADLGGPWIVSFWVMLTNALIATIWLQQNSPATWRAAAISVLITLVGVAAYGAWRLQSTILSPGPRVMVIQSNFRHLPGGAPTVDLEHAVDFFIAELKKNLAAQPVDMVVLPENAFPPLNQEARRELERAPVGPFLKSTFERLMQIAGDHHSTLLVGGSAVTGWSMHGTEHIGSEIRNSAYYFNPQDREALTRYDKVYLVPFAERVPLANGPAWLRRLLTTIGAPVAAKPLFAGTLTDLRPFHLMWRSSSEHSPYFTEATRQPAGSFIAPICLENVDPAVVAAMVRGPATDSKRAAFIANISNDGWFATQEKYQHLQTTVFRCIENRVPMVRCSNTGVSAFIDATGHVQTIVAPNTSGFAVSRLDLDDRVTFYARHGDVFAIACVALVALGVAIQWWFRLSNVAQSRVRDAKKGE